MEKDELSLSPLMLLQAVLRRKLIFVLTVLLAVTVAGAFALRVKYEYEAGAKLLVRPGDREAFSVASATLRGTPIVDRQAMTEIGNTLAMLQSRAVIDRLAERLVAEGEADKLLPPDFGTAPDTSEEGTGTVKAFAKQLLLPPEVRVERNTEEKKLARLKLALSLAIEMEQIGGTSIVQLVVKWSDPQTAYDLASRLLEACRDHYREFYRSKESIAFLEQLAAEAQKKLEALMKREDDIRAEFKVGDVAAEISQVLAQVGRLREEYTACQMTSASSSARVEYLDATIKDVNATLPSASTTTVNPKWTALYTALQNLKLRKLEERVLRTERSSVDAEIERVNKELALEPMVMRNEGPPVPNPLYTSLRQETVDLKASTAAARRKCTAISEEIQTLQLRHNTLERVTKMLDAIELERELVTSQLTNHLRSLQAARTADRLAQGRIANIQVIESPAMSPFPIKNRKPMILVGGALVGVGLGVLLCFLLFLKTREISGPKRLGEVAGVKVIGAIPMATSVRKLRGFRYTGKWS